MVWPKLSTYNYCLVNYHFLPSVLIGTRYSLRIFQGISREIYNFCRTSLYYFIVRQLSMLTDLNINELKLYSAKKPINTLNK